MGEQQTRSVCDQPQDIRRSIMSIINRNYYVNKYYEYDEYGKAVEKGDANFINENTFTGAVAEGGNLYYMNARFYNANTGRFLSQDTYKGNAWEPMSQNLYTYVGNNPINMIDPTGHKGLFVNPFKGVTLGNMDRTISNGIRAGKKVYNFLKNAKDK